MFPSQGSSGTLPGRAAPSRAVINPVQSCSFRHALIAALCVSLNDRQFVRAAFLTNLSFSAPIHSPPFFLAALPLSPSSTAFLQRTSSSLSSSPRLLHRHIYSHFNKNDIWAAILICSHSKSLVVAWLHLPFLNLIYLPRFLFSFSRPCSLTSIISHHPSCSLSVISSDSAVIIMHRIDFYPPVHRFISFNSTHKNFYFLRLPNVLNSISIMSFMQINCSKC